MTTSRRVLINRFAPIGLIAGAQPKAALRLWTEILAEARRVLGASYAGDISAPFVRIVSDPALALPIYFDTVDLIDRALRNCIADVSKSSEFFTIATPELQVRARGFMDADTGANFIGFDGAVREKLRKLKTISFFLLGSSAVTALDGNSIYSILQSEYSIRIPREPESIDRFIVDLLRGDHSLDREINRKLESLVDEAAPLPIVVACGDIAEAAERHSIKFDIDATKALAQWVVVSSLRPEPG